MNKHDVSELSKKTTLKPRKTHVNLLTKRNKSLLIFVDLPYTSLLIINSWYAHCFELVYHGLFMGSLLSGRKHVDLMWCKTDVF